VTNNKLWKSLTYICVLVVLVSTFFLAACAKTTPTPSPTSTPTGTTSTQPTSTLTSTSKPTATPTATQTVAGPTGTLTVAMPSLGEETFLPWTGSFDRKFYIAPIYEYLIYIDSNTRESKPGLATKWEMTPDAKTWTFHLRQGVQFNEGWGELTSADVKYTWDRVRGTGSISSLKSIMVSLGLTMETPDPYTVIFKFTTPYVGFDRAYVVEGYTEGIVCKKYMEKVGDEEANRHPIGSGPYTLAEYKKGSSIKLKAVNNHWRVKPQWEYLNFLLVPEESSRVAMLKAGEADMAPISFDSVDSSTAFKFNIVSMTYAYSTNFRFGGLIKTDPIRYNATNPWANIKVRQALNYAIDRNSIVRNIYRGQAIAAGGDSAGCPETIVIKPYPYDVSKAKQLLSEAGYAGGFPMDLKSFAMNPGAELPVLTEAVAMYWSAIGVKVKITPSDYPSVRGEFTGGKGAANNYCWNFRSPVFGVEVDHLRTQYSKVSLFANYTTDETEAMVKAIEQELDPAKRSQLISKMGQFVQDEASSVFIAYPSNVFATNPRVGEWPTPIAYLGNFELVTHSGK
jgi:peptide/nickel transport system substrate-binding protein